MKRILQLVLIIFATYGVWRIADAIAPTAAGDTSAASGYLGKSSGLAMIVYGESVLQKVVDGAMTTIGSSIALFLVTKFKGGKR